MGRGDRPKSGQSEGQGTAREQGNAGGKGRGKKAVVYSGQADNLHFDNMTTILGADGKEYHVIQMEDAFKVKHLTGLESGKAGDYLVQDENGNTAITPGDSINSLSDFGTVMNVTAEDEAALLGGAMASSNSSDSVSGPVLEGMVHMIGPDEVPFHAIQMDKDFNIKAEDGTVLVGEEGDWIIHNQDQSPHILSKNAFDDLRILGEPYSDSDQAAFDAAADKMFDRESAELLGDADEEIADDYIRAEESTHRAEERAAHAAEVAELDQRIKSDMAAKIADLDEYELSTEQNIESHGAMFSERELAELDIIQAAHDEALASQDAGFDVGDIAMTAKQQAHIQAEFADMTEAQSGVRSASSESDSDSAYEYGKKHPDTVELNQRIHRDLEADLKKNAAADLSTEQNIEIGGLLYSEREIADAEVRNSHRYDAEASQSAGYDVDLPETTDKEHHLWNAQNPTPTRFSRGADTTRTNIRGVEFSDTEIMQSQAAIGMYQEARDARNRGEEVEVPVLAGKAKHYFNADEDARIETQLGGAPDWAAPASDKDILAALKNNPGVPQVDISDEAAVLKGIQDGTPMVLSNEASSKPAKKLADLEKDEAMEAAAASNNATLKRFARTGEVTPGLRRTVNKLHAENPLDGDIRPLVDFVANNAQSSEMPPRDFDDSKEVVERKAARRARPARAKADIKPGSLRSKDGNAHPIDVVSVSRDDLKANYTENQKQAAEELKIKQEAYRNARNDVRKGRTDRAELKAKGDLTTEQRQAFMGIDTNMAIAEHELKELQNQMLSVPDVAKIELHQDSPNYGKEYITRDGFEKWYDNGKGNFVRQKEDIRMRKQEQAEADKANAKQAADRVAADQRFAANEAAAASVRQKASKGFLTREDLAQSGLSKEQLAEQAKIDKARAAYEAKLAESEATRAAQEAAKNSNDAYAISSANSDHKNATTRLRTARNALLKTQGAELGSKADVVRLDVEDKKRATYGKEYVLRQGSTGPERWYNEGDGRFVRYETKITTHDEKINTPDYYSVEYLPANEAPAPVAKAPTAPVAPVSAPVMASAQTARTRPTPRARPTKADNKAKAKGVFNGDPISSTGPLLGEDNKLDNVMDDLIARAKAAAANQPTRRQRPAR